MKITLTEWQVSDELKKDENAGWSHEGAKALASYLCQMDEDSGEDTELDVVAIRCDFSEYKSAVEAAENYSWEFDGDAEEIDEDELEEEKEESALQFLQDRTQVIEFDDGIIIAQF
jgi:hypothetical protein